MEALDADYSHPKYRGNYMFTVNSTGGCCVGIPGNPEGHSWAFYAQEMPFLGVNQILFASAMWDAREGCGCLGCEIMRKLVREKVLMPLLSSLRYESDSTYASMERVVLDKFSADSVCQSLVNENETPQVILIQHSLNYRRNPITGYYCGIGFQLFDRGNRNPDVGVAFGGPKDWLCTAENPENFIEVPKEQRSYPGLWESRY